MRSRPDIGGGFLDFKITNAGLLLETKISLEDMFVYCLEL